MSNNYFALVFVLFFCAALVMSALPTNAELGDTQLLMAFNAGYHEVVASGEYDTILQKWNVASLTYDQCSPESSPLNRWPDNPEGLFKTILVQSKVIAIGHNINGYPPFWNGTGGLEEDLARAVTQRIGAHYNVPDLSFSWVRPEIGPNGFFQSLYQNLETLGSDLILSNVGITPDRQQFVDFSCPYLRAYSGIIRGSLDPERNLTTLAMLDAPGVKVAIQKGTIYEPFAATNLTRATVYVQPNLQSTLSMVADQEAHVALTSQAFVEGLRPTFTSLNGNTLQNVTIYPYGDPVAFGACARKEADGQSSESSAAAATTTIAMRVLVAVVLASALILAALVA